MAPFGKSSKVRSSTEMNTRLKCPFVISPKEKCVYKYPVMSWLSNRRLSPEVKFLTNELLLELLHVQSANLKSITI